ncbi:MAG: D-inositol-3-phosphate glycosyltransferase [Fimbriimonadaceae bacterium]|nr:D-inositol-3-phosphate glycosyltransferase [Fimbriimonadaceae bacterium]
MLESAPLRIALFSDSALPILNGVSISIDLLIRELRRQGHSVHLFTASHFRHQDRDPNIHRFPAFQTPWTRGYPLAIPPFYPMLREFRRHTFDVIHSHTPFTIGFVGLRWAQSHDLPIVATYHTLYDKYVHYVPFFPKWYVRYKTAKHTNFYFDSVDHVITPSEAAQKWLRRHSVQTPMTVISTGVSPPAPRDRSEARLGLGIDPNAKVLLYVGRIAREKNMLTLIKAASLAMRGDPRLHLIIVGDGPFRRDCEAEVRNQGIGDRVEFTGYIPRERVSEYYATADLFVFSSMTETQGLVVVEAMSYGLPSVVVQGGGAAEAVEDGVNGFLVRNDPEVIADRIAACLENDDLYVRLSREAQATARAYSPEVTASKVVAVYREAIRNSSSNGIYAAAST